MNRGRKRIILWMIAAWQLLLPLTAEAEIASDTAFENVVWEKIIEEDIEGVYGVVQSVCATEDYIICLENTSDATGETDVIKAYYRNTSDRQGNPVKRYSLAKRVAELNYEHANGMAYNPNTGEIAVSLYINSVPENRGCLYIMDAETLTYKNKVKISDEYNILGIGYDVENDRYIIQTNDEGGYSFKILNAQFQVTEDLGQYAGTGMGYNFQDLCVSGDYILNFPLTLNWGTGDYIHVYSISRRMLVSAPPLDFRLENVAQDEPESICELEPGVFIAAVNINYADGRRTMCLYKTMVPYNFAVEQPEDGEEREDTKEEVIEEEKRDIEESLQPEKEAGETGGDVLKVQKKSVLPGKMTFVVFAAVAGFGGVLLYGRIVRVRRERKRKLEQVRRERERIRWYSGSEYSSNL